MRPAPQSFTITGRLRDYGNRLQASATAVCGRGMRADLSEPGVVEAIRFVRISHCQPCTHHSCWLQVWLAIGVFSFVAKHSVLLSAGSVDGCLGLQNSMSCPVCANVCVCVILAACIGQRQRLHFEVVRACAWNCGRRTDCSTGWHPCSPEVGDRARISRHVHVSDGQKVV